MANIKELFLRRFNHVMPSVYDDAISYPELLYKMVDKTDEIVEQVNTNTEEIEANKLTADDATEGQVLTADGEGGYSWEDLPESGGSVDLSSSYNVVFVGAPDSECYDSTRGYGNCTIIYNDSKCVVVDFGNQTDASRLIEVLGDKSITKIDAVIITHYHADHVRTSAIEALLNSSIDTDNTVWYLPHKNINWSAFTGTTYASVETEVKNMLSNKVLPDTEGYTVSFGNFSISFYNVDSALYTNYYSYLYNENMTLTENTNYNNFSMVCSIEGNGKTVILGSDIERPAEQNLANIIAKADIIQIPHHGLNTVPYDTAVSALRADVSVLTSYGAQKERAFKTAVRPYVPKGIKCGGVLSTYNGNNIEFNVSLYNTNIVADADDISVGNSIGTMIYSGEDLDDYDVAGIYYIQNATIANAVSNVPTINDTVIGAGVLVVLGGTNTANGVTQIYLPAFSITRHICLRTRTTNGWGEWGILSTNGATSGTAIPENADLDDYTDVGVYYCKFNVMAETLVNCPVQRAFRMMVLNTRGIDSGDTIYRMQIITSVVDRNIYYRILYVTNGELTKIDWITLATNAVATTSTAGLMSASDKATLDTLAEDYATASTALG